MAVIDGRAAAVPVLDTCREVVTPEGVALRLPAAGPMPRALAWLIDFMLRMAILVAGSMVVGMLGRGSMGPYLILLFSVFWLYPIAFEVLWGGRTPGKRALGLRVIAANGAPVGWLAAFARNLLRVVDMLPFGYALGLLVSFGDPWGRRIGDMVAGTLVVHDSRTPPPATTPPAEPMAAPVVLLPHEQAALVAFAERAPRLTQARQIELAELGSPWLQARGDTAVQRLYGIANGLLGRRDPGPHGSGQHGSEQHGSEQHGSGQHG
ncbi:RDD family protein [Marilutibacter alkalisoli]|uniref:RDD family protein n=1 Tax=Marilutibacter alkalisoli TaxID=2591633 RepID=A0A514BVY1_9GAMM|nr:RDD family protein [Lysobacter alkalisoli]QDH71568.1 RDD family protein [Lysobacter alkalisoli]